MRRQQQQRTEHRTHSSKLYIERQMRAMTLHLASPAWELKQTHSHRRTYIRSLSAVSLWNGKQPCSSSFALSLSLSSSLNVHSGLNVNTHSPCAFYFIRPITNKNNQNIHLTSTIRIYFFFRFFRLFSIRINNKSAKNALIDAQQNVLICMRARLVIIRFLVYCYWAFEIIFTDILANGMVLISLRWHFFGQTHWKNVNYHLNNYTNTFYNFDQFSILSNGK